MEKSTQIQSIDIGNDGSAFVEVLIGRSTAPDSYEVLIGMSTFMTPQESKQWSNANRVRILGEHYGWSIALMAGEGISHSVCLMSQSWNNG